MSMRWGKLYKGTPAELSIEDAVAELGVPYRTQFPGFLYGFRFFPDFLLPTLRLVIEVDDKSHNKTDKMLADADRTERLEEMGWRVVRCTNEEALNDPRGTVRAMLGSVGLWPLPARRPLLVDSLPSPRKAPQKERREAASEIRHRQRSRNTKASASPPPSPNPPTHAP